MSPSSAEARELFPEPTGPQTTVSVPIRSRSVMLRRKGVSPSPNGAKWYEPPSMEATMLGTGGMRSRLSFPNRPGGATGSLSCGVFGVRGHIRNDQHNIP